MSLVVKWPARVTDHLPSSSAEVKNGDLYLYSPIYLRAIGTAYFRKQFHSRNLTLEMVSVTYIYNVLLMFLSTRLFVNLSFVSFIVFCVVILFYLYFISDYNLNILFGIVGLIVVISGTEFFNCILGCVDGATVSNVQLNHFSYQLVVHADSKPKETSLSIQPWYWNAVVKS
jgi:hypothetical protein